MANVLKAHHLPHRLFVARLGFRFGMVGGRDRGLNSLFGCVTNDRALDSGAHSTHEQY